ncbi:hypothetical protein HBH70_121430 [Parastagonospora nodorum]|nr:hypothetical protein HBH47_113390 [Parastagonospora nodorum]KAH5057304.1 hypothetical protein HBH96_108400 [Parastagonospora nodorum]KAH5136633.1 hypothetical protein HBH70_121430 [Parastagonospora nodorum]KAH6120687.1 hypothetical protein HBI69_073060 [Parastagonospora nodorum]KAH6459926.1 hypothetical protein HBI57_086480 [Parastagonospora nodorum]
MAPRKLDASPPSAIAGDSVAKRTNKKIRCSTNGPLGVERNARQNQRESPLLKLPADLRNRIFEYAMSGHEYSIETKIGSFVMMEDVSKAPENAFALLEVVFSTCSAGLLNQWLGGLLEAKFNVISKLHLRLDLCVSVSPISAYHLLTLSEPMNDDVVKIINPKVSVTADWCDRKLIEEQSRNAITGIPLQKDWISCVSVAS